jgi:CBS domain-containing protein
MNHLSMERILERIYQSEQFDEMRITRDQVHEMFREHLLFSHSSEIGRKVNKIHDAFIRRTIELSEHLLEDEGYGKPPVPYAFILFGSGGRSEQTLWSDQDNGLIYEESEVHTEEELDTYFIKLVDCILHGLDTLGYPPCEGNVISSNKQWRKTLAQYKEMLISWFNEPDWENVRYLLILADMRCIFGSQALVDQLKSGFLTYVREHPSILNNLLSNTLHHKISLGLFGHLITERYGEDAGGFDIKYGAYIPIVNGIRLLAIQSGIMHSSTSERIRLMKESSFIPEPLANEWQEAFGVALKLRDLTPYQLEDEMYTTRGRLGADQLTKEVKQELKQCLRTGIELQKYVRKSIVSHIEREKG